MINNFILVLDDKDLDDNEKLETIFSYLRFKEMTL
jgi:hypothetical protein